MPSYFENLEDTEISGGDFTSVTGDFVVGTEGIRRDSGVLIEKPEPTSYFATGKGLKITGGNFMSFGGSFYDGPSAPLDIANAPRPSSTCASARKLRYTYPRPSAPPKTDKTSTRYNLLSFGLQFQA